VLVFDVCSDKASKKMADASGKPPPGKHDRPWRKSAAAVKAEREESAKILGGGNEKAGGVSMEAVRIVMAAQELLDSAPSSEGSSSATPSQGALDAMQAAVTKLQQVATNARPPEEVAAARAALDEAAEQAGLTATLAKRSAKPATSATTKLQLLHEVMPRLWVGGWAALSDDCRVLQQKKVTHVVSVISADQRKLPPFIRGHLYVRVDDTEEAAARLAAHFDEISEFIEQARSGGGVVFVHCGAGISRAPTSACAYMIWKLHIPASNAIKLVRSARPCARPNVGFVAALKAWEQQVGARSGVTSEGSTAQQAPLLISRDGTACDAGAEGAPSAASPTPGTPVAGPDPEIS
jgi:predicted protein tyrosine phosphatase